jgi:hypothetical protein
MKLPTLDAFIAKAKTSQFRNSWVREPGFADLYVRLIPRNVAGIERVFLDLANMTAKKPGSGTLTRLVARLRVDYPDLSLYVENALNPRLPAMLVNKLGFKQDPDHPMCFYLISALPKNDGLGS